jgi:hypothetical protein
MVMDDVERDIAREKLAQLKKQAIPRKELAWQAIKAGTDPAYIAHRYGFTVDEMQRAKAEWERRQEEKPK